MKENLCPLYPTRNGRNMLEDLELRLHTYLLFKNCAIQLFMGHLILTFQINIE